MKAIIFLLAWIAAMQTWIVGENVYAKWQQANAQQLTRQQENDSRARLCAEFGIQNTPACQQRK